APRPYSRWRRRRLGPSREFHPTWPPPEVFDERRGLDDVRIYRLVHELETTHRVVDFGGAPVARVLVQLLPNPVQMVGLVVDQLFQRLPHERVNACELQMPAVVGDGPLLEHLGETEHLDDVPRQPQALA